MKGEEGPRQEPPTETKEHLANFWSLSQVYTGWTLWINSLKKRVSQDGQEKRQDQIMWLTKNWGWMQYTYLFFSFIVFRAHAPQGGSSCESRRKGSEGPGPVVFVESDSGPKAFGRTAYENKRGCQSVINSFCRLPSRKFCEKHI